MTPVRHVIYLHGFASSPASSKAERFARELRARQVGFECPDLNEPDFESLTISRMLGVVARAVDRAPDGPLAFVGSSLGGLVALLAGAGCGGVRVPASLRLILLAPAVDVAGPNREPAFLSLRRSSLQPEGDIDDWRRQGALRLRHHAWQRDVAIGFGLYEDAAGYDAFATPTDAPTLVFQGRQDDMVDPASVEAWSRGRANVTLRLLDDGHQLTESIDRIWEESRVFLGLT